MRTWLLVLVPAAFLIGLAAVVYELNHVTPNKPPCALLECPRRLVAEDSGKTFTYEVGFNFSVFLDERKDPQANLHCAPEGIIAAVPDTSQPPPLYGVAFEGITPGTCILTDDRFSATIVIR